MASDYDALRQQIAGETMQAIPAIIELTCSRLDIPVDTRRDRGGGAIEYPDPVTGLLICRQLEHMAGQWAHNYMGDLREDGASWQQLGEIIGWKDDAAASAFAAATASPWLDSETGRWRDDGTFGWRCPACARRVVDHSSSPGAERGHAEDCPRPRGGAMTEEQDVTPASLRRGPVAEPDELILAITRQLELDSQYVEHVEVWDTKRIAEVRSAGRRAGRLLGWKIQTFRSQPTDQGRVTVVVMLCEWPDEEMRERFGERARLLMDDAFLKLIPWKNPPD